MDKLIVDSSNKVTISNDGATIIKQINVIHPAAKTLVDISCSQDAEVCSRFFAIMRFEMFEIVDLFYYEICQIRFALLAERSFNRMLSTRTGR